MSLNIIIIIIIIITIIIIIIILALVLIVIIAVVLILCIIYNFCVFNRDQLGDKIIGVIVLLARYMFVLLPFDLNCIPDNLTQQSLSQG